MRLFNVPLSARSRRGRRSKLVHQRGRRARPEWLEPRLLLAHSNPNAILTTGIYDENLNNPNTVDVVAPGSSMTNTEFAARVASAFADDRGGVIDGSRLGAFYAFGANHEKVLTLLPTSETNWGIGNAYGISGTGSFASTSNGGYNFTSLAFTNIDGGVAGEGVVAVGVTATSITGRDYGNVTFTVQLASGGKRSASSRIFANTGAGDTFFALEAPAGDTITSFSLGYDGPVSGTPDIRLWFDDIGFITSAATIPNEPPVSATDTFSIEEDRLLDIPAPGVLLNDSDPEGATLTADLISTTSNGLLFFQQDGSFRYFPNLNFFGTDTFTYVASDGEVTSAVTTVSITVNAVNDAPFVASPSVTTDEDTPVTGGIDSIDVEGDPHAFALFGQAANGTATVNADGTYTYTPAADFYGTDRFTFQATDDGNASRLGTVTITVNPVNDAPIAKNDAFTTDENSSLTIDAAPVFRLAMQSEPGDFVGQGLSYEYTDAGFAFDADRNFDNGVSVSVLGPGTGGDFWFLDFSAPSDALLATGLYEGARRFPFQAADEPGLDVAGNGRGLNQLAGEFVVYDVAYGSGGTVDRFAASFVQQGLRFDGTVDPPMTGTVQYNTAIGTGAGVLANDQDVDGDLFTARLIVGPSNGVLALNSDGSLDYTPNVGFSGTDYFTYVANDGRLDSNVATVAITVKPLNEPPHAVSDSVTTNEDTPAVIAVLGNDSDPDGDSLVVHAVSEPSHGAVSINADGTLTYVPTADYFGDDQFTYTIRDSDNLEATATVEVSVTPVNDAPTFAIGGVQSTSDSAGPQSVLEIAIPEDAGPQSMSGFATAISAGPPNESEQSLSFVIHTDNGSLFSVLPAIDPVTGTLTFTPSPDANGSANISVRLMDDGGTANDGKDTSVELAFVIAIQSPENQIANLVDQVHALRDQGAVDRGQANALTKKLDHVLAKYEAGKAKTAINNLNAFINQVTDLIETGVLTDAQGQSLIDAAEALRNSMEMTADPIVDQLFASDKLLNEVLKRR